MALQGPLPVELGQQIAASLDRMARQELAQAKEKGRKTSGMQRARDPRKAS
jgi:hypothetical protein